METFAIASYIVCDEIRQIFGIDDDPQSVMINAEVMTFSIIAAKHFFNRHRKARLICQQLRYFP